MIADVLMQVPVVCGHDYPAIGMTMNHHATPGFLVRKRGLDFRQLRRKDGPEQLMRCAANSLRAGKSISLLQVRRPVICPSMVRISVPGDAVSVHWTRLTPSLWLLAKCAVTAASFIILTAPFLERAPSRVSNK
jgi:hypothetical protein